MSATRCHSFIYTMHILDCNDSALIWTCNNLLKSDLKFLLSALLAPFYWTTSLVSLGKRDLKALEQLFVALLKINGAF